MQAAQVVGVTATYGRPAELRRLLDSLGRSAHPLHALILVDNAADPVTRAVSGQAGMPVHYESPGRNLGCGGGLQLAEKRALELYPGLTHLWILDDDCVILPNTLAILLETMSRESADAAHPLTEDAEGRLSWFPGLLDPAKFRAAQEGLSPQAFRERCGAAPVPFSWSQGIALLITRRVLEELGPHRADYWVRGEDLEFTLRITARWSGLYAPAAEVRHLPPPSSGDPAAEYPKHLALLQNVAYTALRLPHGRRIARTLPGNWCRFLRTWGFSPRHLWSSLRALCRGARGHPAGVNAEVR